MSSSPDDIGRFIMEIDILGIDLAKHVFQLHGAERSGGPSTAPKSVVAH
jgi:hypothetical protein